MSRPDKNAKKWANVIDNNTSKEPRELTKKEIDDIVNNSFQEIYAPTATIQEEKRNILREWLRTILEYDVMLCPEGIPDFIQGVKRYHQKAIVQAHTPIGFVISETYGQIMTQIALDAFKLSGTVKNISLGIDILKEIFYARLRKNPVMSLYFKNKYLTFDQVFDLRILLEGTFISDVIKGEKDKKEVYVYKVGEIFDDVIKVPWYARKLKQGIENEKTSEIIKSTHVLRLILNVEELYNQHILPSDVARILQNEDPQTLYCVYPPLSYFDLNSKKSRDTNTLSEQVFMDVYGLVDKIKEAETNFFQAYDKYNVQSIYLDSFVSERLNIRIKGIDKIKKVFPVTVKVWGAVKKEAEVPFRQMRSRIKNFDDSKYKNHVFYDLIFNKRFMEKEGVTSQNIHRLLDAAKVEVIIDNTIASRDTKNLIINDKITLNNGNKIDVERLRNRDIPDHVKNKVIAEYYNFSIKRLSVSEDNYYKLRYMFDEYKIAVIHVERIVKKDNISRIIYFTTNYLNEKKDNITVALENKYQDLSKNIIDTYDIVPYQGDYVLPPDYAPRYAKIYKLTPKSGSRSDVEIEKDLNSVNGIRISDNTYLIYTPVIGVGEYVSGLITKAKKDRMAAQRSNMDDPVLYRRENIEIFGESVHADCNGSNLADILSHPVIDARLTYSNDFQETARTLGIEAARKLLIKEITDNIAAVGSSIDSRIVDLSININTHRGIILGVNNPGLTNQAGGDFSDTVLGAAMTKIEGKGPFGLYENAERNARTADMIGAPVKSGTGAVKTNIDQNKMAAVISKIKSGEKYQAKIRADIEQSSSSSNLNIINSDISVESPQGDVIRSSSNIAIKMSGSIPNNVSKLDISNYPRAKIQENLPPILAVAGRGLPNILNEKQKADIDELEKNLNEVIVDDDFGISVLPLSLTNLFDNTFYDEKSDSDSDVEITDEELKKVNKDITGSIIQLPAKFDLKPTNNE
jgi:hypothetical protein